MLKPLPLNLEKARIQIMYSDTFYGSMLYALPCVEHESIPTMATDGQKIYYNKEWVSNLKTEPLKGVLVHEVLHVMLKHMFRVKDFLAKAKDDVERAIINRKFNMAADYVINLWVMEDGYKLPDTDLCLDSKWEGYSTEKVYKELPDPPVNFVSVGGIMPAEDMSEEERRIAEADIDAKVRAAATLARARGKVPAHIEQYLKNLDESQVDWRARLWRAADHFGGAFEDSSWTRPNKRYIGHGAYVPSTQSFGPGTVVCIADTSGSVSDKELKAGFSEMQGICQSTRPEKVIVLQCDAALNEDPLHLEEDEDLPTDIKVKGRGGTDFRPPFKWLEENQITPQYLVYFTDGYGPFPNDPGYPCIWVMVNSDVNAPFGETIKMTSD